MHRSDAPPRDPDARQCFWRWSSADGTPARADRYRCRRLYIANETERGSPSVPSPPHRFLVLGVLVIAAARLRLSYQSRTPERLNLLGILRRRAGRLSACREQ